MNVDYINGTNNITINGNLYTYSFNPVFNILLAVKSFELFPKQNKAFYFELIYFCGINK